MSAQPEDQQMEGVQETKGKGKATQRDAMEDSEDSSDESGGEEAVCHTRVCYFCATADKFAIGRRTYERSPVCSCEASANVSSRGGGRRQHGED